MIAFNLTGQNLIVFVDGRTFTLPRSDENFHKVYTAVENADKDTILHYLDAKRTIASKTEGRIAFDGYSLTFDGEAIHNSITDKLHYLWSNDLPYGSLLRFMDRLMENPSKRAVDELYRFLEACDLPITNDGYFLAYKRVRSNYTDIHSGQFDNSIGATPRLRRNQVDEDSNRTCSHGLYVCSASYLPNFGSWTGTGQDRIVVVKVDPADVVAVPRDYNNAKMRVCGYEVVDDVTDEFYGNNDNADGILPSHFTTDFDDDVNDLEDWIDDAFSMDDDIDDLDNDDDDIDDLRDETSVAGPSVHATTSKLNERQVREIKDMLATGKWPIARIAEVFDVNESTIRKIRDGVTWAWVK
jgi:hypothetical protein